MSSTCGSSQASTSQKRPKDLSLTADWSSSDEKDTKTKKLALDPNT